MATAIREVPAKRRFLAIAVFFVGACLWLLAWLALMPDTVPTSIREFADDHLPWSSPKPLGEPIIVAAVADRPYGSGISANMIDGARLYFDQLNADGGIDGRPVVLRVYDDQGDAERATEQAQRIADSEAVAVIGHRTSGNSIAAAPIYKSNEIPAISPTATVADVTIGNQWYFRTIGTDEKQARFLARYANAVFSPDATFIIADHEPFGREVANVLAQTVDRLAMPNVTTVWLEEDEGKRTEELLQTVDTIGDEDGTVVVFLSMYPETAVPAIRQIRDRGLNNVVMIGPDSFADPSFVDNFRNLRNEEQRPGFYTDGFSVGAPLVYDTAGREAGIFYSEYLDTFGELPDWRAAFTYDAANALGLALKRTLEREQQSADDTHLGIAEIRRQVREQLVSMDSIDTGFDGTTGRVYFDPNGDGHTPYAIARYEANHLVSALTQFTPLYSLVGDQEVDRMVDEGLVLRLGDQIMRRAAIVFTGIAFDAIREIDTEIGKALIEGTLWFRYRHRDQVADNASTFDPSEVIFTNSYDEIELQLIEESQTRDGVTYKKFNFQGEFRLDYLPSVRSYGRPTLGVEFRHVELPSATLIYIVDLVGMGLVDGVPFATQFDFVRPDLENAGWQLRTAAAYQDTRWVGSFGDPYQLNTPDGVVAHSGIVTFGQIEPFKGFLSTLIDENRYELVFLVALAAFLVMILWRAFIQRYTGAFIPLIVQFGSALFMLWIGEKLIVKYLQDDLPFHQLATIDKMFGIAWWLVPAYYIVTFLDDVVWAGMERRTGAPAPALLSKLDNVIIYIIALLGILAFVFNLPVTSLLATTGLVGLIIGLAVQGNLANIFSGFVLNLERPFRVGDVIEISGQGKKRVLDMTWRSVRLGTGSSTEISVPNADVASATVINHTRTPPGGGFSLFALPPELPRDDVIETIKTSLEENENVLEDYPHGSGFAGYVLQGNKWAAQYSAYWKSQLPEKDFLVINPIWTAIHDRFGSSVVQAMKDANLAATSEKPQDVVVEEQPAPTPNATGPYPSPA